jgi:hypothetical protein
MRSPQTEQLATETRVRLSAPLLKPLTRLEGRLRPTEQPVRRLPISLGSIQRKSEASCGCPACRAEKATHQLSTPTLLSV